MQDIRIERWAHTLVHYSLYLRAGETVAILATPLAAPLVEAVYREALRVGAHPLSLIEQENLEEILLREGNDAQLTKPSPITAALAEHIDARLTIASRSNPKALSGINPARSSKRRETFRKTFYTFRQREQAGQFRWSSTLYPTTGYAQDAEMSLTDFEEFVFDVCFLNAPDPIARWQELSHQQQRFVDWLHGHKHVRILGERTDLTLSIADRIFINSDGKRNFPAANFSPGPSKIVLMASSSLIFPLPTMVVLSKGCASSSAKAKSSKPVRVRGKTISCTCLTLTTVLATLGSSPSATILVSAAAPKMSSSMKKWAAPSTLPSVKAIPKLGVSIIRLCIGIWSAIFACKVRCG